MAKLVVKLQSPLAALSEAVKVNVSFQQGVYPAAVWPAVRLIGLVSAARLSPLARPVAAVLREIFWLLRSSRKTV
jgi:hypothetical protein